MFIYALFFYLMSTREPLKITGCLIPGNLEGMAAALGSMVRLSGPNLSEKLQTMVCAPRLSSTNLPVISSVLVSVQVQDAASLITGRGME